ncbi:MAG TPA: coenzyme F420-0:L-glutamate ligase, partial [Chloroflexota bacterium]|nr:coenzyme F420-0:L-glutamate ligase [Chloroflexota bacterium]
GVDGMAALRDYRGRTDDHGNPLAMTETADADEVAAAAELVMGKLARRPVAIIRGFQSEGPPGTARDLVMDSARDLFR